MHPVLCLQVRQSIALPTVTRGNQHACTLTGEVFAHEGWGSVSIDGKVFMLGSFESYWLFARVSTVVHFSALAGCYDAPVGRPGFTSNASRIIARIYPNGTV